MPSPSPTSAVSNLRPDLQGLFAEFDIAMNQSRYIGSQVLRPIEVGLQAGPFGKIKIESLMKNVSTARASGGNYSRSDYEWTPDSYATDEHGHEVPVDKRNAAIYANYFQAEVVAAQLARDKVLRNYETRVADAVFNATTFSATTGGVSTEWSNPASTPISDVEAAIVALYAKGIVPNALIINWKVFRRLRNNTSIIARITASGAGSPAKPSDVTTNMLAAVFDLPKIIVGAGQKNSEIEGQTAALVPIWSDEYAMVAKVADTDAITEPCVGRTFHWGGDGSAMGGTFETYYSDERRGDVVRSRMETDEKIIHANAGYLLSNITA